MDHRFEKSEGPSVGGKTRGHVHKAKFQPQRAAKYHGLRLLRLRGDPFVLARGVGIGAFIGLTPTIPFHTALIILFCAVGRGNPIAGIIVSILVSNPLTIPLHYYGAWKLGVFLTGSGLSWEAVQNMLNLVRHAGMIKAATLFFENGADFLGSILLGGVLLAAPFGLASYFGALYLYIRHQKRRMKKLFGPPRNETPSKKTTDG